MYAQRLKYLTFEQNSQKDQNISKNEWYDDDKVPKETDFLTMWMLYVSDAFIHQLHKTN